MGTHYPRFPRCLLRKDGSTTVVPASTSTLITWNSELDDNYNMHATNSGTVVIPVSGIYTVCGAVAWASDSGGNYRQLYMQIDGATNAGVVQTAGETTDFSPIVPFQWTGPLTSGDLLTINCLSGVATSVVGNSHFSLAMISRS